MTTHAVLRHSLRLAPTLGRVIAPSMASPFTSFARLTPLVPMNLMDNYCLFNKINNDYRMRIYREPAA